MSDKIITFAKKLTVGVKGYKDLSTENPELSFMTPNTEDASYTKRLATLKGWCHLSRTYDYTTKTYIDHAQNTDNLHSLENVPTTGFRIMNATSRYSTDNKFFRLIDPRGYILEISTGNLEVILQTSDILKGGYIAEPCVWGRQGNNNVLVAVSSEAYAKSVKFAEKNTSKFSDLTVGDIVKFKDGSEDIYLGEYVAIISQRKDLNPTRGNTFYSGFGGTRNPTKYEHALSKTEKYHAFKSSKSTSFQLAKKLKPCVIIGKTEEKIEDYYKNGQSIYIRIPSNDYSKSVHGIFKSSISIQDFQYVIDLTEKQLDLNDSNARNSTQYIVHNETMQIVETYISRIHEDLINDGYTEIVYNPFTPTQYNTVECNLSRKEPLEVKKCTFVTGLKIVANTDLGKITLKESV
jgi:hypothetical protein